MLSLLFFCRISEDKRKGLCCSGKFGTIQQNSVRKDVCDVEVYEGGALHAKRIKYYAPANYTEGSELDILVKNIIDTTASNEKLMSIHYRNKQGLQK